MDSEKHEHSCYCGYGTVVPHQINQNGCCRAIVPAPKALPGGRWELDGHAVTEFTLYQQRGYYRHTCGCWSRPVNQTSENSINA